MTSIARHFDVRVPVGTEDVAATRYTPRYSDGQLPALLMYYPYRRDLHLTDGNDAHVLEYLAESGYEVIVADVVGTGGSSGAKETFGEKDREGREAASIIEWIAERGWCTGAVGMFGKSYAGQTALSAAARDPDPLEAIVPIHAFHTDYEGFSYEGGHHNALWRFGHWFPQMQALAGLPPTLRDDDVGASEVWEDVRSRMDERAKWLFQELEHDTDDEFWDSKRLDPARIETPPFAVGGWRDQFPGDTAEYFEQLQGPKRLLFGPWRHLIPHRGREVAVGIRGQMVEWFDHFLKDDETGALDHDTVEFWTERRGGGRPNEGVWRGVDRWPCIGDVGRESLVSLTPSPDGLISASNPGVGELDVEWEPDYTVGACSLDHPLFTLPIDTNDDDFRSLCFETPPLENALEMTGTGAVRLRIASSVPDPTVFVRIVDVGPSGHARIVTHGRLRVSHRDDRRNPDPVVVGDEYAVQIPLRPRSHLFEAGHRIRLAISGAFFPLTTPVDEDGSFAVRSSSERPSVIEFPGRTHEGTVNFGDEVEQSEPTTSPVPVDATYGEDEDVTWEVTREHFEDSATVRIEASQTVALPQGGTCRYGQRLEATAHASDPDATILRSDTDVRVDDGTAEIRSHVKSRVDRSVAWLSQEVTHDGRTIFEESWLR